VCYFLLGVCTTLLTIYVIKPKPVVQSSDRLELGYDEYMHSFSTTINGSRYTWDIEPLWDEFSKAQVTTWTIPDSFKSQWNWGKDHPSDHVERCLRADLSYPILVWEGKVVDGTHRIIKALAENRTTIEAKIISKMPPPNEVGEPLEEESSEGVFWTHRDLVLITQAYLEYEIVKDYDLNHPLDC
jgi:hypothetical protein